MTIQAIATLDKLINKFKYLSETFRNSSRNTELEDLQRDIFKAEAEAFHTVVITCEIAKIELKEQQ